MVDFDLQSFLREMRDEQREAHEALVTKVDAGFKEASAALAKHDTRITVIENLRKNVLWFASATFGALIIGGVDIFLEWMGK